MEFEQDYIMRMIQNIVRFLIKLMTGKSDACYELPADGVLTPRDDTFTRILSLADSGHINEAENILYEKLDCSDEAYFLMGLTFYSHISEYSEEFLTAHQYTRGEIRDGILAFAKEFSIPGFV